MKCLFAVLLSLLMPMVVWCQLNESDTVKFQIRASVSGNYQKGNVELLALRSKLDITYAPVKSFDFKSQNNSLYQSFFGTKADNDLFSRNYLYYKLQHKVYPFAIGYISANFRRKIDFRYFAGAGVTYQVIRRSENQIKFSVSAVHEQTNFKGSTYNFSEYSGNSKIKVWRATAYVAGWHYFFQKHLRIYYDAFWQPAFNNSNNYRTQFDLGADFPVWKGLAFNVLYTYTHENVVIQNIKPNDRILTFGLSYKHRVKHR